MIKIYTLGNHFELLSGCYKPIARVQGPSYGKLWDELQHFFLRNNGSTLALTYN